MERKRKNYMAGITYNKEGKIAIWIKRNWKRNEKMNLK